jgi:hypothetical protein
MNIEDFLPVYPNIHDTKYPNLNFYEEDSFNLSIMRKKEFYDNKLEKNEIIPTDIRGYLTKYQKNIAYFLSSNTPYDKLLLVHSMGLGKCVHPSTKITINTGGSFQEDFTIEKIWSLYSFDTAKDFIEGEWSTPMIPLYIMSYDEKTHSLKKNKISRLYRQFIQENIKEVITDKNSIIMTNSHRVFCKNETSIYEWTNKIKIGDCIKVLKNGILQDEIVRKINTFFYSGYVYDFEILPTHNYFANNILTHNTCSAIGVIEQIINEKRDIYNGAIIFAKGSNILGNFQKELVEKCTSGKYYPKNYKNNTEMENVRRINKMTSFYSFYTFAKFSKNIKKISDSEIKKLYSNKIIVIDEVHNLQIQSSELDEDEKKEKKPFDKEDPLEIYWQFHRFLHVIENTKILLLSGTPMKDGVEEFASITNLIIPLKDQFPIGKYFLDQYTNQDKGVYILKKEKIPEIKNKLKGKISFLKEPESSVEKKFIGNVYGGLKYFIVNPVFMSKFQSKHYNNAYKKDTKSIYLHSREASLFVYPDGSYGKEGFNKYIKEGEKGKKFHLSSELKNLIYDKDPSKVLDNIGKYSATYKEVIKQILNTNGNCFIYSSLAKGSGAILFSLLLELFNYSKANGLEKEKKNRYAILTNKTASANDLKRINERFNRSDNKHGEYIKVIIGSRAISEGFSFKNVIFEAINTPHWNYSETAQALARGIRLNSHKELLNPVVKISQTVAIPLEGTSIDLKMYKISEDKDVSIRKILRIFMEVAFDCSLNYVQNYVDGVDYSRECYYDVCNYKCDGIPDNVLKNGIKPSNLDLSTYQLYYSNPPIPLLIQKIEELITQNGGSVNGCTLDKELFLKKLSDQFTEEEITNSLYLFDTKYMTPGRKIINGLSTLFREQFVLNLKQIQDNLKQFTLFEILSALNTIIENNILMVNKYGILCYVKEYKNIFFLVKDIETTPDLYSEYYIKYPDIYVENSFSRLLNQQIPIIIDNICFNNDEKIDPEVYIKSLPVNIQEMFIENCIISLQGKKGSEGKNELQNLILSLYKNYIVKIGHIWYSTFLSKTKKDGQIRIFDKKWRDADEKDILLLKKQKENETNIKVKNNPYKLYGKINTATDSFCIVDLETKENKEKETEDGKVDNRLNYPGKNCKSWTLKDLFLILINKIEAEIPKDFTNDKKELLETCKKDKFISDIYTYKELEKMEVKKIRKILYFGTKPMKKINNYCGVIQDFFRKNNLLEEDDQCGIQRKGGLTAKKEPKKQVFILQFLIPSINSQDSITFENYKPDILKFLKENDKDAKQVSIKDNWIFAFLKKNMVGFINYDENGNVKHITIQKKYRKKEMPKTVMDKMREYIKKELKIKLKNSDKNYKKLTKLYQNYGFEINKNDGTNTIFIK